MRCGGSQPCAVRNPTEAIRKEPGEFSRPVCHSRTGVRHFGNIGRGGLPCALVLHCRLSGAGRNPYASPRSPGPKQRQWVPSCDGMTTENGAPARRAVGSHRALPPCHFRGDFDVVVCDALSFPTPSFPRRREPKRTTANWAFVETRLGPHLRGDDDGEWGGRPSIYHVPGD
mgnify:CR=1 FL=1